MKRYLLFKYVILSLFILSCALWPTQSAAKAEAVDIQMQISFGDMVRDGEMFPVKMTLNNPGSNIVGEIVIEIASRSNDGGNVVYAKAIELPQHSEKTVWMSLPGAYFTENNNRVLLYHIDNNKREIIPFQQGEVFLTANQIAHESEVIGLLTADRDTFNFIQLLNDNMKQYHTIHLTRDSLPDETAMLSMLDRLVINDYASSQLSEAQVTAIEGWVQRGGQLIIAGGANYAKAAEAFQSLSPIEYEGTVSVDHLDELVEATGKELTLTTPMSLSYGAVIAGEQLLSQGDIPLYVKRQVQFGSVLYVAYDLSLNPLASWNGNSVIWRQLLTDETAILQMADNDLYRIDQALSYFSELTPPNVNMLILFFIGYIIVAVPILFYILKKWDKRELAWLFIPALAVLSSVSIFIFGSTDRLHVLAQSLNVIEMDGEGQGFKKSYASFFVPRGGTHTIGVANDQMISTFNVNYPSSNLSLAGHYSQKVYNDSDSAYIEFRNIPYRSIRKIQSIDAQAQTYEALDFEVKITAAGIDGYIKNTTNYDLTNVGLYANGQLHLIGDLRKGDELQLAQWSSKPLAQYYGSSLRHMHSGFADLTTHEDALLSNVLTRSYGKGGLRSPFIVAISSDKQPTLRIDGKAHDVEQTNVWLWHVNDMSYVDGDQIYIPYGVINPVIVSSDSQYIDVDPYNNHISMGRGYIEFLFTMPHIANAEYTSFSFEERYDTAMLELAIWHKDEQQWIPFDPVSEKSFGAKYFEGNSVKLRYMNQIDEHRYFQYPRISVEGVVLDD